MRGRSDDHGPRVHGKHAERPVFAGFASDPNPGAPPARLEGWLVRVIGLFGEPFADGGWLSSIELVRAAEGTGRGGTRGERGGVVAAGRAGRDLLVVEEIHERVDVHRIGQGFLVFQGPERRGIFDQAQLGLTGYGAGFFRVGAEVGDRDAEQDADDRDDDHDFDQGEAGVRTRLEAHKGGVVRLGRGQKLFHGRVRFGG